jgi:hypothetical protein
VGAGSISVKEPGKSGGGMLRKCRAADVVLRHKSECVGETVMDQIGGEGIAYACYGGKLDIHIGI